MPLTNEYQYRGRPRAARPSMTRMHFRMIASALAETRPTMVAKPDQEEQESPILGTIEYDERLQQWKDTRQAFIRMCWEANHNFDSSRFIKASEED